VTARASADVQGIGGTGKQAVEPVADYFVGRVKRDFRNGNLVTGAVVSGVVRDIDSHVRPVPRAARGAGGL
jgi:hypothetical protein